MENIVSIQPLQQKDRKALNTLLGKIHQFTEEERQCALELVDTYLQEGAIDYEFIAAVDKDNRLYGFVGFGDISLTDACYDLYWIVCDPDLQKQGIGTRLLTELERILIKRSARKLFAETSSQNSYQSANSFYQRKGFKLVAKIEDFYKHGDDKLIYVKNL